MVRIRHKIKHYQCAWMLCRVNPVLLLYLAHYEQLHISLSSTVCCCIVIAIKTWRKTSRTVTMWCSNGQICKSLGCCLHPRIVRKWESRDKPSLSLTRLFKKIQLTSFVFFVPLCFLAHPIAQGRQSTVNIDSEDRYEPRSVYVVYSRFGTAKEAVSFFTALLLRIRATI